MILSFRCKKTEAFFRTGNAPAAWKDIKAVAGRKLDYLNSAAALSDLRSPPGNRLEPLFKDRKGQHSIRVNDRWRVCFVWTNAGPTQVELVDYH